MVSIFIYDRDPRERDLIVRDCRAGVARESGEELSLDSAGDSQALSAASQEERLLHLLYYDFQSGQELEELRRFRQHYGEAMLMLITDPSVSPLEYLRPGVNPDSLLLRPVDGERLRSVNGEFLRCFFQRQRNEGGKTQFVVETQEERVLIPYASIYYFEARNKKLYVRAKNEEYAFYGTLDALETQLPEEFRRCHRSYIVNVTKLRRMVPGENLMELEGRIGVPVSRSYKAAFREMWT